MVATIELFEALKTRFGEGEAKVIVKEIEKIESGVEAKIEKAFDRKKDVLATKEDLANTKVEIIKWLIGVAIALAVALGGLIIAAAKFIK